MEERGRGKIKVPVCVLNQGRFLKLYTHLSHLKPTINLRFNYNYPGSNLRNFENILNLFGSTSAS